MASEGLYDRRCRIEISEYKGIEKALRHLDYKEGEDHDGVEMYGTVHYREYAREVV